MRTVITGATGLIGRRLTSALSGELVVLSRNPSAAARTLAATSFVAWDGRAPVDPAVFDGADAVIHLAGEPVAEGRWSAAKKAAIEESRVLGTRRIAASIAAARTRPRVLLTASAVGYYGDRGDEPLTEESAPGTDFLARVCVGWEQEARAIEALGVRTCMLRIGIALAREGGALARMLPLFRAGLGGRLGDGKQWMPWIHVDDVVGLFLHAARSEDVRGPVNVVAPEGATNEAFTRELARALHRPAFFGVPKAALRVAMGELAGVVLGSQRVLPRRAIETGYAFRFPSLNDALGDLVGDARFASSASEARA